MSGDSEFGFFPNSMTTSNSLTVLKFQLIHHNQAN